jgi:hypothetical protein
LTISEARLASPSSEGAMNPDEQLQAINQAATQLKDKLRLVIGGKLRISRARAQANITEAILQDIRIATFQLTDVEQEVIDEQIEIALSLEKAINGQFIFSAYFMGSFQSINALVKYAPLQSMPEDGVGIADPTGIWYPEYFLERIRNNPYVTEIYDDENEYSLFAFYNSLGAGFNLDESVEFVVGVIKNLPGFEELTVADPTEREQMILARVGQGGYRRALEEKWGNKCSVLGVEIRELLRASHIKPWKLSDTRERLDADNGLLLSAHLDALFDRHLISFDDEGVLLIGGDVNGKLEGKIDLNLRIRNDADQMNINTRRYLAEHRRQFEKNIQ